VLEVRTIILELVQLIAKKFPQEIFFPVLVWHASHPHHVNDNNNNTASQSGKSKIPPSIRDMHSALASATECFAQGLVDLSQVWIEKWLRAINSAWGRFEARDYDPVCEELSLLMKNLRNTEVPIEKVHYERNMKIYTNLQSAITHYQLTKRESDVLSVWATIDSISQNLNERQKNMKSLSLQLVSPWLAQIHGGCELYIPGTRTLLYRISDVVDILPSKQRPRKVAMYSEDGTLHNFLLKGNEDLRQDERVQQLFHVVNRMLKQNRNTRTRAEKYLIGTYSVTPLEPTVGLCQWLEGTATFAHVVKEERKANGISSDLEYHLLMEAAGTTAKPHDYYLLSAKKKGEAFETAIGQSPGKDLYNYLWQTSPSTEAWLDRRETFTKSSATMSMVGHVLGLGDRHPNNILLHETSGRSIHIDFGDCFEVAMTRRRYPESVPFRLTRMMVNAMGVGGLEGPFTRGCGNVLGFMCEGRDTVIALLEAFVHDPLMNWNVNPSTAVQRAHAKLNVSTRASAATPSRDEIGQKVMTLIKNATAPENLASCYLGWSPYW